MNVASTIRIDIAQGTDAAKVAPLFDSYRMFYGLASDCAAAERYLNARISSGESIVLMAFAEADEEPVGFAQLYPTFSSLQMAPVIVLNDLFVRDDVRRLGVARALLLRTHEVAWQRGARQVTLETAASNEQAKGLYLSEGYRTDPDFEHYHVSLSEKG